MIIPWNVAELRYLPEDRGHRIAYWDYGNPDAPPLLLLHGGPGGGCSPSLRKLFDPQDWRIVAMDQRGAGKSEPHAGRDLSALVANQTTDLIGDMDRLREALQIESWVLYGGSWGVTLAQAYAHQHTRRVLGMVLVGITQTRAVEIDWLYGHLGLLLPEPFAAFQALAPDAQPGRALVAAYRDLLSGPNAQDAADAWCAWEAAAIASDPDHKPGDRWADPEFRLGFARVVTHYFAELGWIDPGLDRLAAGLGDLPGELVHARFDLSAPLATAYGLAKAWPGARLTILDSGLHSAAEVADPVRQAASRLKTRIAPEV